MIASGLQNEGDHPIYPELLINLNVKIVSPFWNMKGDR
jgi:hypothetical protein